MIITKLITIYLEESINNDFFITYPDAEQAGEAKDRYEQSMFLTLTADNSITSYKNFIQEHAASPYRIVAEDSIFLLSTKSGGTNLYNDFIKNFPDNRNVPAAWKKLYTLSTPDGSVASMDRFLKQHPSYPDKKKCAR